MSSKLYVYTFIPAELALQQGSTLAGDHYHELSEGEIADIRANGLITTALPYIGIGVAANPKRLTVSQIGWAEIVGKLLDLERERAAEHKARAEREKRHREHELWGEQILDTPWRELVGVPLFDPDWIKTDPFHSKWDRARRKLASVAIAVDLAPLLEEWLGLGTQPLSREPDVLKSLERVAVAGHNEVWAAFDLDLDAVYAEDAARAARQKEQAARLRTLHRLRIVTLRGRADQVERLAAGVLPEEEIVAMVRETCFQVMGPRERYHNKNLTTKDLGHAPDCAIAHDEKRRNDEAEVTFDVAQLNELTADQWVRYKDIQDDVGRIRAHWADAIQRLEPRRPHACWKCGAPEVRGLSTCGCPPRRELDVPPTPPGPLDDPCGFKDATVEAVLHTITCDTCERSHSRAAAKVTITWDEHTITREYAL